MKLKLFKKYFLTTALIIVFSLTAMMLILVFVFNNYLSKSKYETLSQCCRSVAAFVEKDNVQNTDYTDLFNVMKTLSEVSQVDIFLSDPSGKVKICGCDEWLETGFCDHSGHAISSDYMKRAKQGETFELNTIGIYDNPHFVASHIVEDESGNLIGVVFATAPVSAIQSLLTTVLKLYAFSAVVPLILMFFAIYAMTYRLTRPLKMMSEAAKAMARGDFSKRIPVMSDDEIGELSVSFNQMTNSLVQLEGMRRSFVANVSHELKTPMTTIGGFIDGIIDGTIEPDKQDYYLDVVSGEIKRLSRLVQSMLSMAKLESGEFILKPELFDFRELLCTIVISQEQRIEKRNLNITGLDEVQSVSLNADRDLIYQVIYNLLDNAIKFTNEGGNIHFSMRSENRSLIFGITNTGKGISPTELPYVFERFYKIDKSRSANKESTGLGLYIANTIIKTHGGSISVSSKEDEFTAFEVKLPLG